MKAYEYRRLGLENLQLVERDEPLPGHQEVLVRFHAASLNYRDLMFARGLYNPTPRLPAVPLSDGAGEVVALGEGVTQWKVGDRVCPIFTQSWLDGRSSAHKNRSTLGAGDLDGVLREVGAFHENGLVRIPAHLSYEEAATLPCAAVTAWNALVDSGGLKAGETVLTLGTGGVSVFAMQIAKLFGARVLATSSSDEKLARMRALGADETINYKTTPEWDKEVLRLTEGIGVDHVVEVGGKGTMARSVSAASLGGNVSVIGLLAEGGDFNPLSILQKGLRMRGILVGSRQMFADMNRAFATNGTRPVVDRAFAFSQAREALEYLATGAHFGKIVIRM